MTVKIIRLKLEEYYPTISDLCISQDWLINSTYRRTSSSYNFLLSMIFRSYSRNSRLHMQIQQATTSFKEMEFI